MAVDLRKFKNSVEKKLPIIFLVEENKSIAGSSASLARAVLSNALKKNIHAEIMLLSYGMEWTIRYPKMRGKESSPNFIGLDKANLKEIYQIIKGFPKSTQTLLGSALDLCKAFLDDTDTVKPDRYRPVLIIISSKAPAKGWENHFDSLVNEGRSSKAQVYWVVAGDEEFKPPENCTFIDLNHEASTKKPAAAKKPAAKKPAAKKKILW